MEATNGELGALQEKRRQQLQLIILLHAHKCRQNPTAAALNAGIQLPPPENADIVKHWHPQVTSDLRNHLSVKLLKAVFPPYTSALHDQRVRDLIQYARKVEKDTFEYANDREEYYHLLAEKMFKIQKELQDKKQKRVNQRGGGPGQAGPSSFLKENIKLDLSAILAEIKAAGKHGGYPRGPFQSGAANGQRNECNLPHCNTMKDILVDMRICSMGRQCTYRHCASSRELLKHWRNCNRNYCPFCAPVKIYRDGPPDPTRPYYDFTSPDTSSLLEVWFESDEDAKFGDTLFC